MSIHWLSFAVLVRVVQDQEREQRDCLVLFVPRETIDTVYGRLRGTAGNAQHDGSSTMEKRRTALSGQAEARHQIRDKYAIRRPGFERHCMNR